MTYLVSLLLSLPLIGAYAILAVGIVMIYRASKVLNLAHGAMVMVPPFVVYSLTQGDLPPRGRRIVWTWGLVGSCDYGPLTSRAQD